MSDLWVSDDFLRKNLFCESFFMADEEKIRRAYEIWNHTKELIENADDDFSLSDAVWNLKRCIDQRMQLIEENYNLKRIEAKNKPKGCYERFEFYGIARPFIIEKLFCIRNNIDHHDIGPPSIDRCNELLDVGWYFLKSTDRILQDKKKYYLCRKSR